ncbi:hypothetical protein AGMMS49957_13780 [Synergistales bacterium]|nr:hypothetical protein AGMMS49957_13780 [Synergistales bacterium]
MTQICRLGAQIIAFGLTVAGYNHLVDINTIPSYLFVASVVLAGMFFCGWACPFGAAQEWLRLAGRKLTKFNLNIPNPLHRYLSLLRYALLLFFLWVGWHSIELSTNARVTFLLISYGREITWFALCFMGLVLFLSLFMDRPYCKYLCARGAGRGLAGILRVFTIKRNSDKCINCRHCDKTCPMGIEISTAGSLRTASCVNCFKCVVRCPAKGALKFGFVIPRLRDLKDAIKRYFP